MDQWLQCQEGWWMLQAECGELRKKLEESRKQLDSNDQMIRWLNNQVRSGTFCEDSMTRSI